MKQTLGFRLRIATGEENVWGGATLMGSDRRSAGDVNN